MEKRIQGTCISIRRLSVLLLITLVISIVQSAEASDYCCEFEDNSVCSWINAGALHWTWSGDDYPNMTGIDDFNTTDNSKFEWVQNITSVDATLVSPLVWLDENDNITVELYGGTSPLSKITVKFIRQDGLYPVTIFTDRTTGWVSQNATCGTEIQCCTTYPCKGRFTVEGHTSGGNELVAFKHFLVNECPVIPTTQPPIPSDADVLCNRLESSSPDWVLQGWSWSHDISPDWTEVPEFTHDSDYAFSQNYDGGKLTSPTVKIDNGSEISFDYYVYSSVIDISNSLIVYFHDMDADVLHPLDMLQDTGGNWTTIVTKCSSSDPCCDVHPCSGNLIWEASQVTGSSVLYAIDNLQLNQGCTNNPTCCEFEASSICQMNSNNSLNSSLPTDGWIWSGQQQPDITIPPGDGSYVWRQDSATTGSPATAILQSELVTMYPNSSISFSYFVSVGTSKLNRLYVRFRLQVDDAVTSMDYLSVDSVTWIPSYNVKCNGAHSNCCSDDKGCLGWMEFETISDGVNPALFAIDNLQLDSQCSA